MHGVSVGESDVVVYEYELRIGWGKAVSLPSNALPAPPPGQMAVRPKEFDVHREAASVAWSEPGGGQATGLPGPNSEVVITTNRGCCDMDGGNFCEHT